MELKDILLFIAAIDELALTEEEMEMYDVNLEGVDVEELIMKELRRKYNVPEEATGEELDVYDDKLAEDMKELQISIIQDGLDELMGKKKPTEEKKPLPTLLAEINEKIVSNEALNEAPPTSCMECCEEKAFLFVKPVATAAGKDLCVTLQSNNRVKWICLSCLATEANEMGAEVHVSE